MNRVSAKTKPQQKVKYNSNHRKELAKVTVEKIQNGIFELFCASGSEDSLTYKSVAQKAGVTEVTVYRYFPERSDLLKSLWERINRKLGDEIKMPQSEKELLTLNPPLHLGFSRNEAISQACVVSSQGREMRKSTNPARQEAFLKIVHEINPSLSKQAARRKASILQMLHSAYAWDSLKIHWGMSAEEIAQTTQEALETFITSIKNAREK